MARCQRRILGGLHAGGDSHGHRLRAVAGVREGDTVTVYVPSVAVVVVVGVQTEHVTVAPLIGFGGVLVSVTVPVMLPVCGTSAALCVVVDPLVTETGAPLCEVYPVAEKDRL